MPATTRIRSRRRGSATHSAHAELCAAALDDVFGGAETFEGALSCYQRDRDTRALPIYKFTTQLATLEPPPPEMQQLLGAVHGN